MSIKDRRNAVLKSSISLNTIRASVTNFTKGLASARQTASEIAQLTNENNKFKRTLISNDNNYFEKRRENVRRKQREDELESSSVTGVAKKQGNVISRSTKGFLGRILDFFGIVLIGWFVNNLPQIIKSITGVINRIRDLIGYLTNFVNDVGDFFISLKNGIVSLFQSLPIQDLLQLQKQNEDALDGANANLGRIRKDLIAVGNKFNDPKNANLEDYQGNEEILNENDFNLVETKTNANETENNATDTKVDLKDEKVATEFTAVDTSGNTTIAQKDSDPNNQNLISGIKDTEEFKEIASKNAQSQGETIENRNADNELEKKQEESGGVTARLNNFFQDLFGGKGKQETESQEIQSAQNKDVNTGVTAGIAQIKETINAVNEVTMSGEKKDVASITPSLKVRDDMKSKKKSGDTVIIVEKAISMNKQIPSTTTVGSKPGLNNIGGFNFDNEKIVTKKIQTIILST